MMMHCGSSSHPIPFTAFLRRPRRPGLRRVKRVKDRPVFAGRSQTAVRHTWVFRWFWSAGGHTDKHPRLDRVVVFPVERGADILAACEAFTDTLDASGGSQGVQSCSEQDQLRSGIRSRSAVSHRGWRTSPQGRGSHHTPAGSFPGEDSALVPVGISRAAACARRHRWEEPGSVFAAARQILGCLPRCPSSLWMTRGAGGEEECMDLVVGIKWSIERLWMILWHIFVSSSKNGVLRCCTKESVPTNTVAGENEWQRQLRLVLLGAWRLPEMLPSPLPFSTPCPGQPPAALLPGPRQGLRITTVKLSAHGCHAN